MQCRLYPRAGGVASGFAAWADADDHFTSSVSISPKHAGMTLNGLLTENRIFKAAQCRYRPFNHREQAEMWGMSGVIACAFTPA